jgi:hypothetical protein
MTAMKEMFKDVLQQVMECKLDDKFSYEYISHSAHTTNGKIINLPH